jgi:hypothetical protein
VQKWIQKNKLGYFSTSITLNVHVNPIRNITGCGIGNGRTTSDYKASIRPILSENFPKTFKDSSQCRKYFRGKNVFQAPGIFKLPSLQMTG